MNRNELPDWFVDIRKATPTPPPPKRSGWRVSPAVVALLLCLIAGTTTIINYDIFPMQGDVDGARDLIDEQPPYDFDDPEGEPQLMRRRLLRQAMGEMNKDFDKSQKLLRNLELDPDEFVAGDAEQLLRHWNKLTSPR